jgi:hypothetical protein
MVMVMPINKQEQLQQAITVQTPKLAQQKDSLHPQMMMD